MGAVGVRILVRAGEANLLLLAWPVCGVAWGATVLEVLSSVLGGVPGPLWLAYLPLLLGSVLLLADPLARLRQLQDADGAP